MTHELSNLIGSVVCLAFLLEAAGRRWSGAHSANLSAPPRGGTPPVHPYWRASGAPRRLRASFAPSPAPSPRTSRMNEFAPRAAPALADLLPPELVEELLKIARAQGADFAEVYGE